MADPLPFGDAEAPRRVSLTRLVGEIARQLAQIGTITVEGEVHQAKIYGGGRTYFTLKDRTAQLSVVVPAGRKQWARVKDGERVAVTGRLQILADRGQLQLEAREVAPVGEGAIAAALAEIRERLRADGLLDRPRRVIPMLPACVGVVCGTDAAVRKDIESVVAARFPGYPVRFREVTVQGPGAPEQIMRGMQELAYDRAVQVIILARGGGDAAQLLAFSDEQLCRAIVSCRVPVVSAIGHDGDRPISDDVADVRAGTPSIAADLVIPHRSELQDRLDALERGAGVAFARRVDRCGGQLQVLDDVWRRGPERRLSSAEARLERVPWRNAVDRRVGVAAQRLGFMRWEHVLDRRMEVATARLATIDHHRTVPAMVDRNGARIEALRAQVEALSPARVLARGFAIVTIQSAPHGDVTVVRSAAQVLPGQQVSITLATGRVLAEVTEAHIEAQ